MKEDGWKERDGKKMKEMIEHRGGLNGSYSSLLDTETVAMAWRADESTSKIHSIKI